MSKPKGLHIGEGSDGPVFIPLANRRTHLHIVGPIGSGKSRLLEHQVKADIQAGQGVCLLDPTGALFERLALWCTARDMHRRRRLHFIDPNSDAYLAGYNPLLLRSGEDVAMRVDAMVQACSRVWSENASNTPLLKRCLRAVFTALIEHGLTLVEAIELILPPTNADDAKVREYLTTMLENPIAKRLWARFTAMKEERFEETFGSSVNRMTEFVMSDRMRAIFGYGAGSLDLQRCMDEGHVVLVNLQPRKISLDNSRLLGTLLMNDLLQLARARDNQVAERHPFFCYVDEAYKYLTPDIAEAIDETRQKGLHFILAHQRLSQLESVGEDIYGGVMSITNKVVFGDLPESEAATLARNLFQSEYDENQEVKVLRKPVTVAHEVRRNRRTQTSKTAAQSKAENFVRSKGQTASNSSILSMPLDMLGIPSSGLMDGGGLSHGTALAKAKGLAEAKSQGEAKADGWAESAWPVLEERAGAVRSYEEQMNIFARNLHNLPERTILLKLRRQKPMPVRVPYVGEPIARRSRLKAFYKAACQESAFVHPYGDVVQQQVTRRSELVAKAQEPQVLEGDVGYFD